MLTGPFASFGLSAPVLQKKLRQNSSPTVHSIGDWSKSGFGLERTFASQ